MNKFAIAGLVVTLLVGAAVVEAQEAGKLPAPEKWLQQLVGEWESETEAIVAPGQPPVKAKGTESVRAVGGWIVAEAKGNFMGMSITGIMTVGYDPQKKKFVGTWIDSVTSYLWKYEGTVDATGKVLTLETEGPNPSAAGKLTKFKEVIEVKSKDHKVFTSSLQGDDGQWITFVTRNDRRKK